MLQRLHIDKATNVLVEAIEAEFIRQYWANQGKQVHVTEDDSRWYERKKTHDFVDTLGHVWEGKNDERSFRRFRKTSVIYSFAATNVAIETDNLLSLKDLVRPARFELATFGFGGRFYGFSIRPISG